MSPSSITHCPFTFNYRLRMSMLQKKPKYACTYALKTEDMCIKELAICIQDLSIHGVWDSFCHSLQWDTTTIFFQTVIRISGEHEVFLPKQFLPHGTG